MTKKEFFNEIREAWLLMRIYLQQQWDGLRLTFAIYMADALQRARNKQFYVLDNGHGKLIWLCNDDIAVLKRPRIAHKLVETDDGKHKLVKYKVRLIPKHTSHSDIMRDCYYYTAPNRQNSNGITVEERNQKRKAWIEYMEKYRMNRMFGRRTVKTRKKNG